MYYYNAIIYNINIQYLLFNMQNEKLIVNEENIKYFTDDDLNNIINNTINNNKYTESIITKIGINIREFINNIKDTSINTIENLDKDINILITNIQNKIKNNITLIAKKAKEQFNNLTCSVEISKSIRKIFKHYFIYLQKFSVYSMQTNTINNEGYVEYINRFFCSSILDKIFPNLSNIDVIDINSNKPYLKGTFSTLVTNNINDIKNTIKNTIINNSKDISNDNNLDNAWNNFIDNLYIYYCILIIKYSNIKGYNIINDNKYDYIYYIIDGFSGRDKIILNNFVTAENKSKDLNTKDKKINEYNEIFRNYLLSQIDLIYNYLIDSISNIKIDDIYTYKMDKGILIKNDPYYKLNNEEIIKNLQNEINTEITDTIKNYNVIIKKLVLFKKNILIIVKSIMTMKNLIKIMMKKKIN